MLLLILAIVLTRIEVEVNLEPCCLHVYDFCVDLVVLRVPMCGIEAQPVSKCKKALPKRAYVLAKLCPPLAVGCEFVTNESTVCLFWLLFSLLSQNIEQE